jgi:glycosyltransferase involved in cell wall biosynthesis
MDFTTPPPPVDDYARSFRAQIGMGFEDLMILQPTRVVARKGIEHSVELVRRLGRRDARLVISHAAGDEGNAYVNFLRLFSDLMQVKLVIADRWIGERRGTMPDGRRQYAPQDVYQQADLVVYPSEYEGFGNAFLEAVYYGCPILCKRYPIFRTDIEPYGFRIVHFDDYITRSTVKEIERLLSDPRCRREMAERNYRVGQQYFS